MMDRGFVYLVGAGPGDPKLLTLRALEVLQSVDVVAHDELVPPTILEIVPASVERLRVGRRHGSGRTAYRLHPAVLERARAGAVVARLKSGDPLIFGRGGEEAEELAAAGIPFEVVPGVSAALGAAAAAGIPLTHRECASDVTFVSGHDAEGSHRSWTDWPQLAAGRGTIVLFMASRQLAVNLERLVAGGRPAETPAAYIASATMVGEQVIVGTLGDLADRTHGIDPTAPALVIVGAVVARRVSGRGRLAGCRVLVARARSGRSEIGSRLRGQSAEVLEAPLLEASPPESYAPLDAALTGLRDFKVVLFDAKAGVDAALNRLAAVGLGPGALASVHVVAIGEEVAAELARQGVAVAATIDGSCGAALRTHAAVLYPGPLLLVTREGGRPSLQTDLEGLDVRVELGPAYGYVRSVPRQVGHVDLVVLPSSSAATALLQSALGPELLDVPMVAMGPRSEGAARRFGARRVVRARRDDVEAMIEGVRGTLGRT